MWYAPWSTCAAPVELAKSTLYTIKVLMTSLDGTSVQTRYVGPLASSCEARSYYPVATNQFRVGKDGQVAVTAEDGSVFTFQDAADSVNGTNVFQGQIPALLYSPIVAATSEDVPAVAMTAAVVPKAPLSAMGSHVAAFRQLLSLLDLTSVGFPSETANVVSTAVLQLARDLFDSLFPSTSTGLRPIPLVGLCFAHWLNGSLLWLTAVCVVMPARFGGWCRKNSVELAGCTRRHARCSNGEFHICAPGCLSFV